MPGFTRMGALPLSYGPNLEPLKVIDSQNKLQSFYNLHKIEQEKRFNNIDFTTHSVIVLTNSFGYTNESAGIVGVELHNGAIKIKQFLFENEERGSSAFNCKSLLFSVAATCFNEIVIENVENCANELTQRYSRAKREMEEIKSSQETYKEHFKKSYGKSPEYLLRFVDYLRDRQEGKKIKRKLEEAATKISHKRWFRKLNQTEQSEILEALKYRLRRPAEGEKRKILNTYYLRGYLKPKQQKKINLIEEGQYNKISFVKNKSFQSFCNAEIQRNDRKHKEEEDFWLRILKANSLIIMEDDQASDSPREGEFGIELIEQLKKFKWYEDLEKQSWFELEKHLFLETHLFKEIKYRYLRASLHTIRDQLQKQLQG